MNNVINISWKDSLRFINNIGNVHILKINHFKAYKMNGFLIIQGYHINESGDYIYVMEVKKKLN